MDIAGLEAGGRRIAARVGRRAQTAGTGGTASDPSVPRLAPIAGTWTFLGIAFDARIVQLVVVGTTMLMIAFNHVVVRPEYTRFVLYFVVPIAVVVFAWREHPRRYGLSLGNWRLGLPIVAGTIAVMALVELLVGRSQDFLTFYRPLVASRPLPLVVLDTSLEMLGWEFFCRGWLLFTLSRKYGTDAIWLQVMPFALMHLFKPESEQLSTIVGGLFFGLLAWKTRSFLYGWAIHTFMVAFIVCIAAGWV